MTVLLAVPPSIWVPPLRTIAPIAVPPNKILWLPPLLIIVPLAAPALKTDSMPPLSTVVATAVPPARTYSNPPLLTIVSLAVPVSSWVPPLLMVVLSASPAVATLMTPPLSTAALMTPPLKTSRVPPERTIHPPDGEPEETFEVTPLVTVVMLCSSYPSIASSASRAAIHPHGLQHLLSGKRTGTVGCLLTDRSVTLVRVKV